MFPRATVGACAITISWSSGAARATRSSTTASPISTSPWSSTASSVAPASTSAACPRRCTSTRPTSPSTSGTRAGSASTPRWTRCAGATSATAIFGRIDPISVDGHDYRANRSPNFTLYDGHARFTGPKQISVDGERRDHRRPHRDRDRGPAGDPRRGARRAAPHVGHGHAHRRGARAPGDRRQRVHRGRVRARVLRVRRPCLDDRPQRRCCCATRTRRWPSASPAWRATAGTSTSASRSPTARGDWSGVALTLLDGTVVRGDMLLVAAGRVPNGDLLDLEKAGIEADREGRVLVDDQQRTSVDGVFALGDASSPFQLKHVANHEAKVVQHNLLHPGSPRRTDHRFVPSRGVHRPADRVRRPHRGAVPGDGPRLRREDPGVRRRRLRLGDGGRRPASAS